MRAFQLAMSEIARSRRAARAIGLTLTALMALVGFEAVQAEPVYSGIRTSEFTYRADGLLESETIEPDQPELCVKTSYTYGDGYGNRTATKTANCAGASTLARFADRSASVSFGTQTVTVGGVSVVVPKGTFAIEAVNALSQSETRQYDPRFGVATRLVGPNQLVTTWTLDDFGRKVLETRADGTSTAIHYCWAKVYDPASSRMVEANSDNAPSNSPGCHNGASPAIASPVTGEVPANAVRYEHTVVLKGGVAISGFARVYFDRAGRKIRSVAEAFDGSDQPAGAPLIVQDVDYDKHGVAIVSTQPYFLATGASTTSGGAYGVTKTEYDALGRAIVVYTADPAVDNQQYGGNAGTVDLPNGRGSRQMAKTSISHDGLKTVTTDDRGHVRSEEKNLDGAVVRSTDTTGAQVVQQYDAFGNLVITKDPLGNRIRVDYDARGRKVATNDPDAGVVAYCYDALGQLKAQQTSAMRGSHTPAACPAIDSTMTAPQIAQWTTIAYDALGRMTSRAEPEYTSYWSYDGCTMGVGKLCQSGTSHGVTRKFEYDSLGRPSKQRTDVAGDLSAGIAVSYDASGRLLTQTYPTGVKLRYQYTPKGFLSAVQLDTKVNVGGTSLAPGSALWRAGAFNAWGKAEKSSYGNGVNNRTEFQAQTGRVVALAAGADATKTVVDQSFLWDSLSLLVRRLDRVGDGSGVNVQDLFTYDDLGRLTQYDVSGGSPNSPSIRTVTLQYNALGMLLSKSDVGNYVYGAQGMANGRPHAVLGVQEQRWNYGYDLNGNATSATGGKWRSVTYTSFNMADVITGAGPQSNWKYDESHQRIKETRSDRITWYLHPDNAGGLGFEREIASNGTQSNRHYISAGGQAIAVLVTNGSLPALDATAMAPADLTTVNAQKLEYWHKDQLGSLIATTDHAGAVTARYSYDPFGKRRYANSSYDAYGNLVVDWRTDGGPGTDRGFTGHEHLDDMGIVHMNGRLYDPTIARIMQADPFVQEPRNLQNYDRYAYCFNSPLVCTDPTGYFFLTDWIDSIFSSPIFKLFAVIVVNTYLPGSGGYLAVEMGVNNVIANSAIAGFVSGAVMSGNLKGALQGAFTAGVFAGVGNFLSGVDVFGANFSDIKAANLMELGADTMTRVALHGVAGCVTSTTLGGKCGAGALSAAFSEVATVNGWQANGQWGALSAALVGGTASVLGGGKFANGAVTAAAGYLFNCGLHWGTCKSGSFNDDPRGHEYEVTKNGTVYVCMFSEPACSREVGLQGLRRFPAPFADGDRMVSTGDISTAGPFGFNPVLHVVDTANFAVFNITRDGHMFADANGGGYVYRNVQTDSRGVYIQTYGTGNGPNAAFNNLWVSVGGWLNVDMNIRMWYFNTYILKR